MAMAMWSCSGANLHCYSTASSQRYNVAPCIKATLRRCCNTRRGNTTALLQHVSWQRYGTVVARVVAALRRYCIMRHDSAMALLQLTS